VLVDDEKPEAEKAEKTAPVNRMAMNDLRKWFQHEKKLDPVAAFEMCVDFLRVMMHVASAPDKAAMMLMAVKGLVTPITMRDDDICICGNCPKDEPEDEEPDNKTTN
jgi:hypothetical protein